MASGEDGGGWSAVGGKGEFERPKGYFCIVQPSRLKN